MLHGEGWQFIQMGRFMERVQATARLIDLHFAEFFRPTAETMNASEHMEWIGLLRTCTAFEAYCKVYTADLRPERVAEFLLLNAEFPHSVRFAVDHLRRSLGAVHEATARKPDRLDKLAGRLTAALSYTPLEEIMSNLHEFSLNIRRLVRQHSRRNLPGLHHLSDRGGFGNLMLDRIHLFSGTGSSGAIVGRTPWSARVPQDPLFCYEMNFIQSQRADEGVGCGPGGPPHTTSKLSSFEKTISDIGQERMRHKVMLGS